MLQQLKSWAHALKNDGMTLWFCCRHPRMPLLPKILGLLVVGYFLSPIDLIPDFIPVLGYVDDLILLPVGIYFSLKLVPAAVLDECRRQAAAWLDSHQPKPRSVAAAIFIMLLWMLFFGWLWRLYGAQALQYFDTH